MAGNLVPTVVRLSHHEKLFCQSQLCYLISIWADRYHLHYICGLRFPLLSHQVKLAFSFNSSFLATRSQKPALVPKYVLHRSPEEMSPCFFSCQKRKLWVPWSSWSSQEKVFSQARAYPAALGQINTPNRSWQENQRELRSQHLNLPNAYDLSCFILGKCYW